MAFEPSMLASERVEGVEAKGVEVAGALTKEEVGEVVKAGRDGVELEEGTDSVEGGGTLLLAPYIAGTELALEGLCAPHFCPIFCSTGLGWSVCAQIGRAHV